MGVTERRERKRSKTWIREVPGRIEQDKEETGR